MNYAIYIIREVVPGFAQMDDASINIYLTIWAIVTVCLATWVISCNEAQMILWVAIPHMAMGLFTLCAFIGFFWPIIALCALIWLVGQYLYKYYQ